MEAQLIKICGIAILATILIIVTKEAKSSFPWALKIGAAVLIGGLILLNIQDVKGRMEFFSDMEYLSEHIALLLRTFGIAFLVKICSDVCRECGEGSLAFGVESAGKLCILYMCIPIIQDIFGYLSDVLALGEI